MVSAEVKLWFLSSLEHFWPDPQDTFFFFFFYVRAYLGINSMKLKQMA